MLHKFNKEDFFTKVNLHIHSTFSDGRVDFLDLIQEAEKLNLELFSITDHNTFEGYYTLEKIPPNMIIGIEFDCFIDLNLPHILGYGVDINNEELKSLTAKFDRGKFSTLKRIFTSRNPKKVIEAIHNAGGIAVLAHPCCYWCISLDRFVQKLVSYGLDGIEVYYPYNRLTRVVKFHSRKTVLKLAEKYNLIKTGGEDCHTSLIKENR